MRSKSHNKTIAYLCLAATSIVWGFTWIGSRYGATKIPGLQLSYLRMFVSGSLVVSFYLLKGFKLPSLKQFGWLAMVGFFMFFLNNGLGSWSVHYISGGLAALISALYPICTVLVNMLVFKNHDANRLTFAGLLVGIIGVLFVLYQNAFGPHPDGYMFGVLICFIGVLAWSFGSLLIARNKHEMNPYYAMGWQMFIASFMICALALETGNNIPLKEIPPSVWEDIAFLAIIGSIFTFMAFIYSLRTLPPAIASIYAYINPIVAMLAGAWLLHESLTINLLIGSLITVAGVYLVNYSLRKKP